MSAKRNGMQYFIVEIPGLKTTVERHVMSVIQEVSEQRNLEKEYY